MRFLKLFTIIAVGAMLIGCSDETINMIVERVDVTQPPVDTPPVSPPTNTPTPGDPPPTVPPSTCRTPNDGEAVVCGDGDCVAPEECDIGGLCVGGSNEGATCTSPGDCSGGTCTVVGGQPDGNGNTCAANCTIESERQATFSADTSAFVQTAAFQVPVPLSGSQVLFTGKMRADDTVDINGETTFKAGDIPLVSKTDGLRIDPAPVAPLVCACVRGIEVPSFGPGNAGIGVVSCGGDLENVDYTITQDHHTDPVGGDFVPLAECSLAADPSCSATAEVAPGAFSEACREGEGAACSMPTNVHVGTCISPRTIEFAGSGPTGSAILFNNIAIGLLQDGGRCEAGDCTVPDYGPDCMPCTDDDLEFGVAQSNPTTTGAARARIFNLGNNAGEVMNQGSGTACTDNSDCTGPGQCGQPERCLPEVVGGDMICGVRCSGQACNTVQNGAPFSCSALQSDPNGGLSGGGFAVAFPSIDSATIGDNVTTALFQFEQ